MDHIRRVLVVADVDLERQSFAAGFGDFAGDGVDGTS